MTSSTAAPVADTPEPVLLRDDADGVATLTLNRPDKRNGLTRELIAALQGALDATAGDDAVRAVVIGANGPAFCAGHDMTELLANPTPDYYKSTFKASSRLMQTIVRLPKPVIARVQGVATAAGCQLVASCDLAVAAEDAKFATPGVDIGLFCSTPMVAVSRNVGRKKMMEMLLTGEAVDARAAVDIGLINRAVAPERLDEEVAELARKIIAKSAITIAMGKEAYYRQLELDLTAAYEYTSEVMARNMMTRDADEGIRAFLEKRRPLWEDR